MKPFETTVVGAGRELQALRDALRAWLVAGHVPEPVRGDVVLATHEAVANALEHGASSIPTLVRATLDGGTVVVEVIDHGQWRHARSPPRDDRGRGLEMIRRLVGRMEVDARSDGTTMRMHTEVADPARHEAGVTVSMFG